ncbi:hexosaminidase D isoform X2 [Ascaphus truei]|uniref:hexosaminidase D isoform X2 n=1 Tax=Ascaphus truei TaxID=8439 RepID=UPI003F5A9599
MVTQRKILLLRLGVLIILSAAGIKYFSKTSAPQAQVITPKRSTEDLFWGKKDDSERESEPKNLPPEPPREEHGVIKKDRPKQIDSPAKDFSSVQMKLVHLDLKGAAPKVSYYGEIFPLLAKLGANGVLIEYEDMFPFSGELEVLKSPYAYSEADIEKIQHLADINKLEVVPLVQTFGHMEYVLKHDKYRGMREVERYPNSLNPHAVETLPLVKMILNQVLDKHPMCKWVHIGADEVYHLGEGQDSKTWLNNNKGDVGKMFLSHVKEVGGFLQTQYPDKQQLMWDDMLRKLSVDSIKASGISQYVSPVLWIYKPEFDIAQTEKFISKYQDSEFSAVWFASAFKGASGPAQIWTPIGMHMKNHQRWKQVIDAMSRFPKIRYQGIILTGWQRYDHYSVLCELLPVGIPSLAVSLQTLQHGTFTEEAKTETANILGFSSIDVEKNICDGNGAFPGSEIYNLVKKIHQELKPQIREILEGDSDISGWFSRYHRKHRFGNPHKMETFSSKVLKAHEQWENLTRTLRSHLEALYFSDAVEEWMEEHVNPHLDPLREMVRDFQEILKLNARPKAALKPVDNPSPTLGNPFTSPDPWRSQTPFF